MGDQIHHLIGVTAELLGANVSVPRDEIMVRDEYIGPAYGTPTPEGREAIRLAARTEGLFLDPVYTGKVLAGIIDMVRKGELTRDHTVILLHTGGTPALFAHADYLGQAAGADRPAVTTP